MKTSDDEKRLLLSLIFGMCGQILNGSKSDSNIVYNANIIIGKKKHWFGDFRKQWEHKLFEVSKLIGEDVYLLREMDARFDNENNPKIENAVFSFKV
jgi:hypothetical protein